MKTCRKQNNLSGVRLVKYRPPSLFSDVTISFMSWKVLKVVATKKHKVLGIFRKTMETPIAAMAATFGTFGGPRFSVTSTGGPEPDPLPNDLLKSCHSVLLSVCTPWNSGNLVTLPIKQRNLRISDLRTLDES